MTANSTAADATAAGVSESVAADATVPAVDDARLERVGEIISSAVKWSTAAGLVPVPVLDLVALGAVQTRMLIDLSEVYEQPFAKESAHTIVSVLLGTLLPGVAVGALVGSGAKFTPVVGTLVGMVSMSALGTAATYAVGKVFARHLAGGGKPGAFSAEAIKDDLKLEFERAKKKLTS